MAETKNKTITQKKVLNLDEKVTLRNIAGWGVGFQRRVDIGFGDVAIPPHGSIRISRNEILAQIQNGNKLISGVDGNGSHATLIIDDIPTRIEAGFETEDGSVKQMVFSDQLMTELFSIKNFDQFQNAFMKHIVTRAEKYAAIDSIRANNLNDFRKIRFIEKYTGFIV